MHQAAAIVRLRPSRIARAALAVVLLAALGAIVWADLPWYGRLAAATLAAAIALHAWRTRVPVALRLHPDGTLEWREAAQDWQAVTLLPSSHVTPWLCVLACRSDGRAHHLVIYPDSLHREDFRRLRVWLRWRANVGDV